MPMVNSVDFEIFGHGRPIAVLHGGNVDRNSMIDAMEPVFEGLTGWMRLYLDTPGHGASPAEGIKCNDDVLERLGGFLETALEGQRFCLVGESRGGYYARVLAHRFAAQLEGLMMIVPADAKFSRPPDEIPELRTLLPAPELRDDLDPLLHSRFDRLVIQNACIVERMARTKGPALKRLDPTHQKMIADTFPLSGDPDPDQKELSAPTLVVLGRQDSVSGYRHMLSLLEAYPRGTFAVLDGAGHSLSWERPELFLALAQDWLQRVSLEGGPA